MLTVIIPVLNEEKTIGNVIRFCQQFPLVTEIIVVDDKSEDNTVKIAEEAGATVIISQVRGKGISMKDGIAITTNEFIIFLDGDIDPYPEGTITNLAAPLLADEADFVKGSFARNAGRVTELVAKPLLNIFYPGLSHFSQPLSGMIAGKKSYFKTIDFFNDYGVDIGILIDMYLMKARVTEVNIGYIENKSKPWQALGKMSKEVSKAIISKAQLQHPEEISEEEIHSLEAINREMNKTLREKLSGFHKMAIFDMDDTILQGRFIDTCAITFGFTAKLEDLRAREKDPIILTKRIGSFLKGRTMDELLNVASQIEMVSDIKEVVKELKNRGYIIGIISNSYTLITNFVRQKIGADFSYANQLEFFEGKVTGEINLPSYFFGSPDSVCGHSYCKTNALQYACEKYNVPMQRTIVVGDSRDDRCMVGHGGKGVAFCTKDDLLETIASTNIRENSFQSLLAFA
ncbi:glycosyl transferase family 2 [Niastella yeongjuensis]|uniref:Glycosyl transferase family 2 n=1 Tax=Niastella yeongjuensis TaxID=354355 RepID=A0A1V9EYR8_9BACT|nr:HAD-IB family phosphatase [Niastella yeongjuensis]OQP51252.1 glycosyl transferase family 2 [Niastella yeongjuensis]SEP39511.1 Haloacid Dehalogenase superfamily, subfamily IB, phosphoserine phosphatase-like [Niastella yeongjuensis]